MKPPKVLFIAVCTDRELDAEVVERMACKRGYIVTNARRLSGGALMSLLDGTPVRVQSGTQLWISDVVATDFDGQESA